MPLSITANLTQCISAMEINFLLQLLNLVNN